MKFLKRRAKSTEFRQENVDAPPGQREKRQAGEVPYPMAYTHKDADFDIWDTMLLSKAYNNRLTVHKLSQPPRTVLDIGCGSGYWIIQAARQWPETRFVGIDLARIQPDLTRLEAYKDLAKRVEWVHQNFLDTLPFSDASFDFVRMSGLGLAVPEDEWRTLLEDVFRVMKPGGILEIIVDDPIFPCSSEHILCPSANLGFSAELKKRKSGFLRGLLRIQKASEKRLKGTLADDVQPEVPDELRDGPQRGKELPIQHPQDHSRLKAAWDALVAQRFFPTNLLSTIPLHLTSTSFEVIQTRPPVTVSLPPNSGTVPSQSLRLTRSTGNLPASSSYVVPKFGNLLTVPQYDGVVQPITSSSHLPRSQQDSMQLGRVVQLITACKGSLMQSYKELYGMEAEDILRKIAPGDEALVCMKKSALVGYAFEIDWKNWWFDMSDRMGRAAHMQAKLGWTSAFDVNEEISTWRGLLAESDGEGKPHRVASYNPNDLCRSLCVFVSQKP